jgi:hypothetical protein
MDPMTLFATRTGSRLAGLGLCLAIAGPTLVVEQDGEAISARPLAITEPGSFALSDGHWRCDGRYDRDDRSLTIVIPLTCSDGRRGSAITSLGKGRTSGEGRVRFDDGREAVFVTGPSAER